MLVTGSDALCYCLKSTLFSCAAVFWSRHGSSLRLCSFLRLQAILSALHTPPLGKLPALHLPALLSPFARWISRTQVSHSTPLSSPGATPSPIKSTPTPPATATTPASSHDSVHLVSPSPLTLLSCILFIF